MNIEDYLDEDDYQYIIYTSGYATIIPYALKHDQILTAFKDVEGVDAYITRQVQDPPVSTGVLFNPYTSVDRHSVSTLDDDQMTTL